MAEDSELEKTEPASQKRLDEARENGDVPRSRELATFAVLMAAGAGLWMSGPRLVGQLGKLLSNSLAFEREQAFDMSLLLTHLGSGIVDVLIAFAPIAAACMLAAIAAPMLIGGFVFSGKAFMPNFAKLNPLSGLMNLVSSHSAVELGKAVAKAVLVGVIAWVVVRGRLDEAMTLATEPLTTGSTHLGHMLLTTFILLIASLAVTAAIDAPYQLWHYANKLKMTREELRQEAKESEGNPEIKAKIRATQREMARRRMMAEIPTADVVVTNPTHYAVALKYTDGKMRAPKVVAKGADEVAAKIREIAGEHRVPLLEAPPLARALYRHTELGDEIPQALYTAVAEVLAYVFQLRAYGRNGGMRPQPPTELDVPKEMDPLNGPAQPDAAG
ncbi:flagellar biosynthesis protein FlhB [Noviherbaspirillum pedocola]|uniref:Flagellar biosynthetic protein FlhB n=1 Tax=Noviherbaspirillum pedocola TaxID=2801341 RepID=A0A934T2N9_9BURK|nr:flagellar biosynthesis protein FlhB [Noviherbaspirillum pedocola]MBK4737003.1 flagellar type III secretion system protein FlhB [Noviherbaspirillum pedocola]